MIVHDSLTQVARVRALLPALSQIAPSGRTPVFFDAPGGAQVTQRMLDAMTGYLSRYNANLGAPYFSSQQTVAVMQQARESVAALLNAQAENIVFGPTATNLMFGFSRALSQTWQAGDEIIVSALDHYSNVSSWQRAAQDRGVTVHQVRLDPETLDLDYVHLARLLNARTRLVAVTHASNVSGQIVDVARVVALAKSVGALTFVDAVHYAPHHLVDVQALDCDFLAISAYKFTGPHVASLYAKTEHLERLQPYKVEPAACVNPHQWEQGTQNFEGLAALSATVEYLADVAAIVGLTGHVAATATLRERLVASFAWMHQHEQDLSAYFLERLAAYPQITLYGRREVQERTPTFAFRIAGRSPREFSEFCGQYDVCVGDGHFYAQGLVTHLGLMEQGGVNRLGFLHYNTRSEIERFFELLDVFLSQP